VRLSANPEAARLHMQHGRVHRHDGPRGRFFQRAAEELAGATLRRLEQVCGDRIVLVEFTDTPSGERRALLGEFVGRHANLLLLGREDRIMEVLVAPGGKGAARLAVGAVWSAPGGSGGAPLHPDVESLADSCAAAKIEGLAPLSRWVEEQLEPLAEANMLETVRKRLRSRVSRKLSRARSTVNGLERRRLAAHQSDRTRQDGELLKAELGRMKRGQTSVVVQDWFSDGQERKIELDPRRSPQENVERQFERYRKLERARATLDEEIERASVKLKGLEELALQAEDPELDPRTVDAQAVERKLLDPVQQADPRKRKVAAPRLPFRTFRGCKGGEIRVGRTARDNDTLTLRHARGNDLWLHTADAPGSHVVLRLERKQEPETEEILDAAHLAIHFSPLRGTDRADVHVVPVKQVHKPRGAKPGLVHLSGGRNLQVRMQPERLAGLLRTDR
jgi:predicted ribosome quality control (RQC) complex YloA/Tae2 family protein